jgi:hypothetical protein
MRSSRCTRRLLFPAFLLLTTCLVGCDAGLHEVSGTVFYDGNPLPAGTIQFLGADGVPRAGDIGADGTFSVQVPMGEAQVIVASMKEVRKKTAKTGPEPAGVRSAPAANAPGLESRIPMRYASWATSGLSVTVTSGKQVQDFSLTSKQPKS